MPQNFYSTEITKLKYTTEPTIAASLTGITVLHQNVSKSRFSGSRKFIVDRRGNLVEKQKKIQSKKKLKILTQKRFYQVNKTRVTHLILNYVNQQIGTKKLYFYTITFPKNAPDQVAYKCLNSWLTSVRQAYKLSDYIWIAERQKSGTIHFHICIRQYLPIRLVNNLMAKLLHYYIRKKELNWNHLACSRYNGIDICKDRKTKKVINFAGSQSKKIITQYLTKYITKGTAKFTRQAWQSSRSLSRLFTKFNLTFDEFETSFLNYIDPESPIVETEYYSFFCWRKFPPPEIVYNLSRINQKAMQMCNQER